ncbi:hypothetical protein ACGFWI_02570 [Streptomyces sp. NPDC048434]|uniref:hypothetical protein n=1 Tax=Streptomyces sp. NPDC048434 TaxID=3365549 RepID=UPI0037196F49
MNRLKKAAAENRNAAAVQREHGHDGAAEGYETRAEELESGRVVDRTDDVIGLFRAAFRR